jgi:urease accessory protein
MARSKWTSAGTTLAIVLFAIAATPAFAHSANPKIGGFYAGFIHPITALEHVLPFFVLGILSGQLGEERGRYMALVFPGAVVVGALGALWIPGIHSIGLINILSAVVFGALVASAWRMPPLLFYSTGIIFGFTHGYANGAAIGDKISPYYFIPGVAVAAAVVIAYGMLGTEYVLRLKVGWPRIAVRVAGSWVAAIGILVLSLSAKALLKS